MKFYMKYMYILYYYRPLESVPTWVELVPMMWTVSTWLIVWWPIMSVLSLWLLPMEEDQMQLEEGELL